MKWNFLYQITAASRIPDYGATAHRSPFYLSSTEFVETPHPPWTKILDTPLVGREADLAQSTEHPVSQWQFEWSHPVMYWFCMFTLLMYISVNTTTRWFKYDREWFVYKKSRTAQQLCDLERVKPQPPPSLLLVLGEYVEDWHVQVSIWQLWLQKKPVPVIFESPCT